MTNTLDLVLEVWVDSDGTARVAVNDCEAFDDGIDTDLPIKKLELTIKVPLPQIEEATHQVGEDKLRPIEIVE